MDILLAQLDGLKNSNVSKLTSLMFLGIEDTFDCCRNGYAFNLMPDCWSLIFAGYSAKNYSDGHPTHKFYFQTQIKFITFSYRTRSCQNQTINYPFWQTKNNVGCSVSN